MSVRIMIVDDSALVRLTVRQILSADPRLSVVHEAPNGQDALDNLGAALPHLIILDIEMPVMDGLTFLKHVRLRSKAKVIILSSVATAGSEKAAEARALGADAVIAKPSGAVSLDLAEKRGSMLLRAIKTLCPPEESSS